MSPVRIITAADIPAAMRLKDAAGWNQTEQDWRNALHLAPEGCFGLDVDGTLTATTTAVCFGRELAWIGMVLTHPDHRGRGLARALMEHALQYLSGRAAWIKLDATDMGRPLYQKLGFEDECAIERWFRPGDAPAVSKPGSPAKLPGLLEELDRKAFGADRSELLAVLSRIECKATGQGYAMARPGSKATYFGPCTALSAEFARHLIDDFLARHAAEAIYWDLMPHNAEAARLATERGFQPLRKLVRMAIPGPSLFMHDDSLVYAIAGFEYG
jgi:GNAT superfamily N-acetyltransferase